jgi:DNA (cytosine-5)-methyltransferase 1
MESSPSSHHGLLSLFCGAGGLDEGFAQAGFTTQLAYDVEPSCVDTIQYNHSQVDGFKRDLSQVDVHEVVEHWKEHGGESLAGLLGGPPCQSFSRSNVYKTEDDPRDTLPRHYARILNGLNKEFGLDFFVFENVPGLLDDEHIDLYRDFKERARDAGFVVSEDRLDAQYFEVPQVRERIFIVGLNEDRYSRQFKFPSQDPGSSPPTVRDAIENLPEPVHYSRSLTPEEIDRKAGHPNNWCMRPRSDKFDPDNDFLEPGTIKGRSFRTLAWDEPSYTVAYGHREVHVHPSTNRRLSIFEAMRLQGFPDSYELRGNLSEQIDMISDAVAPPVARALASALKNQLYVNEEKQKETGEHDAVEVQGDGQLSFTKDL